MCMNDVQNRNDLELIVKKFYEKAIPDPVIGHFFTEVIPIDWDEHIQVVTNFWDSMIFGTSEYKNNPMSPHIHLNSLSKMQKHHFEKWLALWTATIHEHFEGDTAREVINRATSIARIMEFKMNP